MRTALKMLLCLMFAGASMSASAGVTLTGLAGYVQGESPVVGGYAIPGVMGNAFECTDSGCSIVRIHRVYGHPYNGAACYYAPAFGTVVVNNSDGCPASVGISNAGIYNVAVNTGNARKDITASIACPANTAPIAVPGYVRTDTRAAGNISTSYNTGYRTDLTANLVGFHQLAGSLAANNYEIEGGVTSYGIQMHNTLIGAATVSGGVATAKLRWVLCVQSDTY